MALGTLLPARIPAVTPVQTKYLSPSGSDAAGGDFATPWRTPEKAFDAIALTGGQILCRGGTYTDTGEHEWNRSGNASNPVQIKAYPSETPVFAGDAMWLIVGDYLRIGPGLEFDTDGGPDIIKIHWGGSSFSSFIEVVGNRIQNNGDGQACSVQPAGQVIGPVQIWDNDFIGGGPTNLDHQIYFAGGAGISVIANNVFRDVPGGFAVQLYPEAKNLIVVCNTIYDITGNSCMVIGGDTDQASSGLRVVGNIVANSDGDGIQVFWEGAPGSGNQVSDCIGYLISGSDFDSGAGVSYINCLSDTNPLFDNAAGGDFHISDDGSPAKALVPSIREGYVPALDKDGNARQSADAGAYAVGTGSPPPPPDQPPQNVTAPTVSGSPVEGETLDADSGEWANGVDSFDFQWQRCNSSGASCANIGGATSDSYVLTSADIGSTIRVVVTATNAEGSTDASSAVTAVVGGVSGGSGAPVNTVAPSISGVYQQGRVLTAGPGTWTGDTPMTFSYQWRRCDAGGANCVDIVGATGQTRLVASADVGHTLRVAVVASN